MSKRNASESAIKLNKKLNDNRKVYEEEKLVILKEHKKEVKAWRKDLGRAVSKHLKLEKKLALFEAGSPCLKAPEPQ